MKKEKKSISLRFVREATANKASLAINVEAGGYYTKEAVTLAF